MGEQQRAGVHYLEAATALLQRVRAAHPTKGLYEAADVQWCWRTPRSTDDFGQLFWFDQLGRPEAAVIATDWGDRIALDPILRPDASPDWVAHVIERGLAHAGAFALEAVELEVDRDDAVLREVLTGHGFAIKQDGLVETWLVTSARPEISRLHDDHRLFSRLDTMSRPHHMIERSGPDVEHRLLSTSLYRSGLASFVAGLTRRPDADWCSRHLGFGPVEQRRLHPLLIRSGARSRRHLQVADRNSRSAAGS